MSPAFKNEDVCSVEFVREQLALGRRAVLFDHRQMSGQHGKENDATGYKGFYYHWLDMQTGRRAWNCELSTIDSTFLVAGALTAAAYFNRDSEIMNRDSYGGLRGSVPILSPGCAELNFPEAGYDVA